MSSNKVAQARDDEDRGQQHQVIVDPVLAYVQAWDAKRFGDLERILNRADNEEALSVAFLALHKTFNGAVPYTDQLYHYRATGEVPKPEQEHTPLIIPDSQGISKLGHITYRVWRRAGRFWMHFKAGLGVAASEPD